MIVEVEQGSDAWHALRYGRLTATRLSNALGLGYDSPFRTWEIMTGRRPEASASRAMDHGKNTEQLAADEYAYRTGRSLAVIGNVIHDRLPFLSASPDRLVEGDGALEIKCPYRNGVPETDADISPGYLVQVLAQLACLGDRDWCHLLHFAGPGTPNVRGGPAVEEGSGAAWLVVRDASVEEYVLSIAKAWYATHVVGEVPPDKSRSPLPGLVDALRTTVRGEVLRW